MKNYDNHNMIKVFDHMIIITKIDSFLPIVLKSIVEITLCKGF